LSSTTSSGIWPQRLTESSSTIAAIQKPHGRDVQVVPVVERRPPQELALDDRDAPRGRVGAGADRPGLVEDGADGVVRVVRAAVVHGRVEELPAARLALEQVVLAAAVLV
jgi:hypothetical protein